jgi:hypothetical protein
MNVDDIICAVEVAIILYLFLKHSVKITVIKEDSQEMLIKESDEFLRGK